MTSAQKKFLSFAVFFLIFGIFIYAQEFLFSGDTNKKPQTTQVTQVQNSEGLIKDIIEYNSINLKKILIRSVIRSEYERYDNLSASLENIVGKPVINVQCIYESKDLTSTAKQFACWKNILDTSGSAVYFVINTDASQKEELKIYPKDRLLINGVITKLENAVVVNPILADEGKLGGIQPIQISISGNVKLITK